MDTPLQRAEPVAGWTAPDAAALRALGISEPERCAEAIALAAAHPDLTPSAPSWSPALLTSARPAYATRTLLELAALRRAAGAPLDLTRVPLLPSLLGASSVLARTLLRHPEWIDDVAGALPPPPDQAPVTPSWSAIRAAKYRGLLRVAARDLAPRPFEASLGELSDLADRCLRAALVCAADETGCAAPALLALGKLGGRELNFSSDVDLLFVYELEPESDPLDAKDAAARLIRHLKSRLEEPSDEGFGYRVDLNLRPEGRAGVLANPVDAALTYYESFGAEWERQMLIRLRPLAGPETAATRFARGVVPFVYRSLIGLDVMRSVRAMKARIESERRAAGRDIDADLKEGPGGIRDIEFLVQAFQLLHGGREPRLRTGNVLAALRALGELELLPYEVIRSLRDDYLWLRRAEHALQLADEQQTARMPARPEAQAELARRMGYREARVDDARAHLLADWSRVQTDVRRHFEALVLGGDEP